MSGSLARPLTRLAATARRLGQGDLSARAHDVWGADEIEELAGSFDEMAGRVERTVQAQREFVANASHQLRTPLTGMKLRLESAIERSDSPEMTHDLTAADREIDRLAATVDRLLVMARTLEEGGSTSIELHDAAERAAAVGANARRRTLRRCPSTATWSSLRRTPPMSTRYWTTCSRTP